MPHDPQKYHVGLHVRENRGEIQVGRGPLVKTKGPRRFDRIFRK